MCTDLKGDRVVFLENSNSLNQHSTITVNGPRPPPIKHRYPLNPLPWKNCSQATGCGENITGSKTVQIYLTIKKSFLIFFLS